MQIPSDSSFLIGITIICDVLCQSYTHFHQHETAVCKTGHIILYRYPHYKIKMVFKLREDRFLRKLKVSL